MFRCVSTLSRFRGPQARRIRQMVRRVGRRYEWKESLLHGFQVYALDGYAYLFRGESVLRLDWFELCEAVRVLERRAGRKVVAA